MSDQYMKELLRIAVAQICQTIGYNATQTAPLELLQDVLDKFLKEFTRDLRRQVEHYNRTEANLNDVTLTLSSINVNLNELLDYINNVEPVPFALEVPKFPAHKDSALNFLKPGSKEVLTRRVHIHDHLPPMLPPEITPLNENPTSNGLGDTKSFSENNLASNNGEQSFSVDSTYKNINGSQALDKNTLQSLFKPSSTFDDGERPTREVSSVVMTTGGYISPAVEGKMPEAMVPEIIDKLLGLDAPPPPPPPPPPPQPKPARSETSTPNPPIGESFRATEKDLADRGGDDVKSSISKETKKTLARNLEPQPITSKKLDLPLKKDKIFSGKNHPQEAHLTMPANYNKKSYMLHQNTGGLHTPQTNYANMLLKKAKKQKVLLLPGQSLSEKHAKPVADKMHKLDAADKAHRKYMKMLQKMAKQGKIPPEILSTIMGPDKKSKIINPAIVASMPPGPEKTQLEKLMRKQAKQRQKILKQQMLMEAQKPAKKNAQPPPLVPIFPSARMSEETFQKPLNVDVEEHKLKTEQEDIKHESPVTSAFKPFSNTPLQIPTTTTINMREAVLGKTEHNSSLATVDNPTLTTADGKELKLSNEPDRTKLNIFKKISKQKIPKSSSPTPVRMPGINDTPIINLPSGTTITPTPGPASSTNSLTNTPVGRNLFPSLPTDTTIGGASTGLENNNVLNVDNIKDEPLISNNIAGITSNQQPTDLTMINRVFGEKPMEAVELVNKPKKRGRKPGSKNSPKIPGVFPNNLLKKNSKKANLANGYLFVPPNMAQITPQDIRPVLGKKGNMMNTNLFGTNLSQLPPDLLGSLSKKGNLNSQIFGANFLQVPLSQFFLKPISNTTECSPQNKQLQQQMMMMAAGKDRKEHKKKNKLLKQELLYNDTKMANMTPTPLPLPSSEEVQSINKKLMRMDTILKAQPPSNQNPNLTIDTGFITDKKLPSPSTFPASTQPLKSPGNSKRSMMNTENMAGNLIQPFMLTNRPPFPNLPGNMLSMLQFPFPTRPGLIPTPVLFPTQGLAAFPNNPKNPLLPSIFPFPNLKQTSNDNAASNQDTEDLTMDKKKLDANLLSSERSYCNVAPLVPDFLTKLNDSNSTNSCNSNEPDLPKTPKLRNAHSSSNLSQDNFVKKLSTEAHTPESAGGSISSKSIPSTPGGMSLNSFEQLMKKNDSSPIDLIPLGGKHSKSLPGFQESGIDFSMSKKQNHPTMGGGGDLTIKTPITLNNEPIEVSDDSDDTNQPPPPAVKQQQPPTGTQPTHNSFSSKDDMFTPLTLQKSLDSDLSIKELKKLKKQVKKSSSAHLMSTDKTDGLMGSSTTQASGVGKLAGGADLIPLTSTGLAYSSKNIPYNSLTANANPTFNAHKNDFNSNHPTSSSMAGSSVFDNLTITAAIPSSSAATTSSSVYDLQKKRKEHKKLKKLKELKDGKIKKKKDKKDKNKSKEKAEKYLLHQTQHNSPTKEKEHLTINETISSNTQPATIPTLSRSSGSGLEKIKGKDLTKKLKKEKKKEKQRTTVLEDMSSTQNTSFMQISTLASSVASTAKEKNTTHTVNAAVVTGESEVKKQKLSPVSINTATTVNEPEIAPTTLSATPSNQASLVPKLTLKLGSTHSPTPPREDGHKNSVATTVAASKCSSPPLPSRDQQREPSPELARISPLVTRPPKHKLNSSGELVSNTTAGNNTISAANASSLDIGDSGKTGTASTGNMIVPPPSPWLSGGTISASSVLLPHQLLQTTKQHDLSSSTTSTTHSTDTTSKTLSADRQSPLTLITETSRPSSYIDAEGNRVWICPACGKVDDGSPMIGCDGCDAWYHWVCVGIFVAPKDNEDWFCRVCITRKKGLHGSDKKRKRNKKK